MYKPIKKPHQILFLTYEVSIFGRGEKPYTSIQTKSPEPWKFSNESGLYVDGRNVSLGHSSHDSTTGKMSPRLTLYPSGHSVSFVLSDTLRSVRLRPHQPGFVPHKRGVPVTIIDLCKNYQSRPLP